MDTLVSNMPDTVSVDAKGLSSVLAHNSAFDEMNGNGSITDETEMYNDAGTEYTAEAQEVFDRWYSYYMESIFNYSTN